MPTSELSDALNPHIVQTRQRTSQSSYADIHLQPVVQPPQVYIPHRSELELAISEPPPPPPPPPPQVPTRPFSDGGHVVHDLLRLIAASKEAQEIEQNRRRAWEQEQETKYMQRRVEMERELLEMRQEVVSLRSTVAVNPATSTSAFMHTGQPSAGMLPQQLPQNTVSSASPVSPYHDRQFPDLPLMEGSYFENFSYQGPPVVHTTPTVIEPLSPAPSPPPHSRAPTTRRRKEVTPAPASSGDESSDDERDDTPSERPQRINHHDTRCLTIHQAMRLHIARLMRIESSNNLPDSHVEGVPLGPRDPIRFEWNKTPKQSAHNSRMKARTIADMKSHRRLYKHVPERDFSHNNLDSVFDQAFVTLRQKFRAQRDSSAALSLKKREDVKATKARRLCRKKAVCGLSLSSLLELALSLSQKLNNRTDARNKHGKFEHSAFDGAFQVECMSSEESDSSSPSAAFRIRGLAWRSSRLQRFYDDLDEDERLNKVQKPKRGVGKKERRRGPCKDGFQIPPKGVASWMISKRWVAASQRIYPDLLQVLKTIITDQPDCWDYLMALGEESSDEL